MEWIVFILVLVGLYYLGYRHGVFNEEQRKRLPPTPKPFCDGCSHHLSFHKNGQRCHAENEEHPTWKCGCRKYIGPEPLTPEYLPSHES